MDFSTSGPEGICPHIDTIILSLIYSTVQATLKDPESGDATIIRPLPCNTNYTIANGAKLQ
jgi:hypothetical protein